MQLSTLVVVVVSPWRPSSPCPQTGRRWTSAWWRRRWAPPGRPPGRPTWPAPAPGGSSRSWRARRDSSWACLLPEVNYYSHSLVLAQLIDIYGALESESRLINQSMSATEIIYIYILTRLWSISTSYQTEELFWFSGWWRSGMTLSTDESRERTRTNDLADWLGWLVVQFTILTSFIPPSFCRKSLKAKSVGTNSVNCPEHWNDILFIYF